jgi:hypothetical protein
LFFGYYSSYAQNDSSTNIKSKIVSPWIRSGNLSFGGTNFNFNGSSLEKFSINIIENINYKLEYNKNKVKQVHLFQQFFSLSKHGKDDFHKEMDNLSYQYRLEIDHKKNTNFGFLINLFTHSSRGTSSGSVKDTSIISNFFTPAIITEGITYGYNNKGIHVTYSPLSGKHTLVPNKNVDPTHYGLDNGKIANHELGTFFAVGVENLQILKNVTFSTDVLFFSNYIKDFGNIAVTSSSKLQIDLTKWLSINHSMVLNHDNDHNAPIAEDLVTNTGTSIVYTGSKVQISNLVYLSININLGLIKKK